MTRRSVGFGCLILFSGVAAAQPVVVETLEDSSFLAVRLDKGGLLSAFAGHQHGILATDWSADICMDRERVDSPTSLDPASLDPTSLAVSLRVAAPALHIDSAEARRRVGLRPDNGPASEDVARIQQTMLAPENLSAADHPAIVFESRSVNVRSRNRIELAGDLTIRGRTRELTIPTLFRFEPDGRVVFSGEVAVAQSDFGIEPASVAGVVKVKDEATVSFRIEGRPTNRICEP